MLPMAPPVRVSARANKGKSTLSTTSPPPQASKRAPKKAQRRPARRPTPPPPQPSSPLFITSSPPPSEQPDTVEEDDDNEEDKDGDKEDDEDEEGEEEDKMSLPPVPVSFMSRWKVVSGREALSGVVSSKYDTDNLFYHLIERWRDIVIGKCLPRIFIVNRLEAAVSYEKQLKANNFLHEINDRNDLYRVLELLKDLREQHATKSLYLDFTLYMTEEKPLETPVPSQAPRSSETVRSGRRTATQIQEANLPNIIAAEEAAGNRVPALASRWPCINVYCSNKGGTCWQNRRGGEADRVEHHYPVNAHILQRWSKEIQTEVSTVEEPSQNMICQLSAWKMRRQLPKNKGPEAKDNSLAEQVKDLVQLFTVRELHAMRRLDY